MASVLLAVAALSAIAKASSVLNLNGTSYYSPDQAVATLDVDKPVTSITPFTYFNESSGDLTSTIASFLSTDDVFSDAFLNTVLVSATGETDTYLESSKILSGSLNGTLRPGPYFIYPDGSITKAYRLYDDPYFAFVESCTPGEGDAYVPVTGSTGDRANGGVSIAVPSRLYFPEPSQERPLEGKRLAVKDIFDLKGIRTSAGSRSYFALDKIANETGPALQALIDLGAVVVGKTKTTQFALGEAPTADYVDQLAPFNPRGDGYQNPQGSSSGSAAGVAAYEWLDFGTGSDTGG